MSQNRTDGIDTSAAAGRTIAGIFSALSEYERKFIRERTVLRLEPARKLSHVGGRPHKLTTDQAALARRMKTNEESRSAKLTADQAALAGRMKPDETAAVICRTVGVSTL